MVMNKNLSYIHIILGDITKQNFDAIVNAANPSLLGGGGVDGAIHKAAGPQLFEECKKLGGCNPGEARITKGFNIKTKYIIHTPGPVYYNGKKGEDKILSNSYNNSLLLAKDNNCKSIAFPAISTGIYGYPKNEACQIAMKTVLKFIHESNYKIDIYFILFDEENFKLYRTYYEYLRSL